MAWMRGVACSDSVARLRNSLARESHARTVGLTGRSRRREARRPATSGAVASLDSTDVVAVQPSASLMRRSRSRRVGMERCSAESRSCRRSLESGAGASALMRSRREVNARNASGRERKSGEGSRCGGAGSGAVGT